MTKMMDLNSAQDVPSRAAEEQLCTLSKRRKMFVREILEEYRKEEQMVKSWAESYDRAFRAVYHGRGSYARTGICHAQFKHGLMETLRAKEKLQKCTDFKEAGFLW